MRTRGVLRKKRRDISGGLEPNPIPVLCPKDVPLPAFEYITTHSILNVSHPPRDRLTMKGCDCEGHCRPETCNCMKYSREINEVIECCNNCECRENCINRAISRSKIPKLYLKYGTKYGFGVFANQKIERSQYVAAYVGEISEFRAFVEKQESDYTFTIDSNVSNREVEIDGTHKSNVARFFNHSCSPNLMTQITYYGKYRFPHPVFFARKTIYPGEELFIDYGDTYFAIKGIPCKCQKCSRSPPTVTTE